MWGDTKFPRAIWSEEKVLRLFNSELGPKPRGTRSGYGDLLDLLSRGELAHEHLAIACRKRPNAPKKGEAQSEEWRIFRRAFRGGGDLHGWLKWWAYNWLTARAGAPAEFEVSFKGYGRVDVHSKELSVFLECGNTSPSHTLFALRRNLCSRSIVLPFQRAAVENAVVSCIHELEAVAFFWAQSQQGAPADVPAAASRLHERS